MSSLKHYVGSFKKLSPLIIQKDSFNLELKPSKDSYSFRVMLTLLEKLFKYLTKFACNFLESLMFECNLPLLRFF